MSTGSTDIDPYAELESRADAAELSEDFRPRIAVLRQRKRADRFGFPVPRRA